MRWRNQLSHHDAQDNREKREHLSDSDAERGFTREVLHTSATAVVWDNGLIAILCETLFAYAFMCLEVHLSMHLLSRQWAEAIFLYSWIKSINRVLILAHISVTGPPEQFSTLHNGYYFFIFIFKIWSGIMAASQEQRGRRSFAQRTENWWRNTTNQNLPKKWICRNSFFGGSAQIYQSDTTSQGEKKNSRKANFRILHNLT